MYDICIIGSGQSGLVTCKTFAEKNKNIIVLEKSSDDNGLFSTIKEKDYFKWSTSRSMSGFSDFPMDKNLPHWFTIQNYIDYLRSYKQYFQLEKYIQYNSYVTNCKQNENQEWIVNYRHNHTEKQLVCKKLIVCSGLNQTPKYPDIIKHFKGEVIHANSIYREMTKQDWKNKFQGKRVLLLGGGESAFDAGHIILQYTDKLYYATQNYIEWYPQGGENEEFLHKIKNSNNGLYEKVFIVSNPTDTNLLGAEYSLPEPMSEIWHTCGRWILHTFSNIDIKCNHQYKDLCEKTETPDDLFLKYVVKRNDFVFDLHDNKVKIIYYPNKIENKTVYTKDEIVQIDIIVCATGYKKTFPFLDDTIVNDEFIKKMIPKNTSNIAFIGFARPTMGSIASIAEMQSWWVESYFYNHLQYTIRKPWFRFKDTLQLTNEHINTIVIGCYYLKDLAKDMNIEPNMVYLFFTDFALFKTIYTGSCHPMIYRIQGDKYYSGARETLMNTFVDFKERNNNERLYFVMFVGFHILFILFLFLISYFITNMVYIMIKYSKRRFQYKNISWLPYLLGFFLVFIFYYYF